MIYFLVILGISLCSVSQLLLKKSAGRQHNSLITEVLNPLVIVSYSILFCSLAVNIWAMSKGLNLKELAMLESLGYVFVPLLSFFFLKEKISKRTLLAIAIILLGIFVFYS